MTELQNVRTASLTSIRDALCIGIESAESEFMIVSSKRERYAAMVKKDTMMHALAITFAKVKWDIVDCGTNASNNRNLAAAHEYYLAWLPHRYELRTEVK
jgi:hypothetical protein